jgi:hypothetical protein
VMETIASNTPYTAKGETLQLRLIVLTELMKRNGGQGANN